jgi:Nif-specific regulatory protein
MDDFACRHDQCLSAVLWKGNATSLPERPHPQVPLPLLPSTAGAARVAPKAAASEPAAPGVGSVDAGALPGGAPDTERERLIDAMERAGWVQAKAARILGLTPRQIGYALKKHGIEIRHF